MTYITFITTDVLLLVLRLSHVKLTVTLTATEVRTASTKSHASGKIKNNSFRISRIGSYVFFDADSESPHMT